MYLVSINTASFVECLFKSFAHFKLGCLLVVEFKESLYVLDTSPLVSVCIVNTFSGLWLVFPFSFFF